jgi:hypothetical protein
MRLDTGRLLEGKESLSGPSGISRTFIAAEAAGLLRKIYIYTAFDASVVLPTLFYT